ncbi:ferritin-like domain-containing protein [Deinococcus psychrotolerans]|uniref:Ferritin-like domain-containing protein n=1 Tax=Deinococcus psychrotolerans TaxID=2489213 RepID=A0A3G8YAX3_9DEIO|nr:ferritin-like domain-containing protein [Deinococcus psychrotolerans]AZI42458.1 ferritin-like domain-containing protein [Deinococcus psychrotolerans]
MSEDRKLPNRRQFLSAAGLMGAGAVLASCAPAMAAVTKTDLDVEILNFALNLEYLEGAFYLAAVGRLNELEALEPGNTNAIKLPDGSIPAGGSAAQPAYTKARDGVGMTFSSPAVKAYATEIANDELAHVKFLRNALGASAAPRPVLDIGPAFGVAAALAASAPAASAFSPYTTEPSADLYFLHGSFIFEDVGVTAYKGAARFIVNDKPDGYLEKAAGILAVEAYHAAEIRTLLYANKDAQTGFGVDVKTLIGLISALRGSLGGGKDQGIVNANGSANIVPTDSDSIAFSRTPRQVGNIVFGAKDAAKGLFFPNGLSNFPNGNSYAKILAL